MDMGDIQGKAVAKANRLNGAARVVRVRHGVYRVPSATQPDVVYTVTGDGRFVTDYACTCPAGRSGIPCWHAAAVRLRKTQEEAKADWRRILARRAAEARTPEPDRAA